MEQLKEILHDEHGFKSTKTMTFYNQDGVQITSDTLILIKNNDTVYYEPDPDKGFDYSCLLEQYEILETLGKGGFGSVRRGKHKFNNSIVAIKYIDITPYCIFYFYSKN